MGDSSLPRSPRKAMLLPLIANIKENTKKHIRNKKPYQCNLISLILQLLFTITFASKLFVIIKRKKFSKYCKLIINFIYFNVFNSFLNSITQFQKFRYYFLNFKVSNVVQQLPTVNILLVYLKEYKTFPYFQTLSRQKKLLIQILRISWILCQTLPKVFTTCSYQNASISSPQGTKTVMLTHAVQELVPAKKKQNVFL